MLHSKSSALNQKQSIKKLNLPTLTTSVLPVRKKCQRQHKGQLSFRQFCVKSFLHILFVKGSFFLKSYFLTFYIVAALIYLHKFKELWLAHSCNIKGQDECIWWFCRGICPMPIWTAHKQQAKGQLSRLWNESRVDILVIQKYLWEIPVHHKIYLWNWGMNCLPHKIITFFWNLQDCYNCVNVQAAVLGSWKSVDAVKILHIQNCYPKLCSWDDKIQRHLVIKLLTKFSMCLNIGIHRDEICTRRWVPTFICHMP